jgi:hypothetical protein
MRKERNHYTSGEKLAILRRHQLDRVPGSVSVRNRAYSRRCFATVKKIFSRRELPPSSRRNAPPACCQGVQQHLC